LATAGSHSMAHHRLGGRKKPKLIKIKTKKRVQDDAKENKDGQPKGKKAKKKAQAPLAANGDRQMNKKEARAQANLEKMHRNLYAPGERVLLVGEGNLSFARALCRHLKSGAGVYATCLDAEEVLKTKYADAAKHRKEIEEKFGGTVLTGVDALRLHRVKEFKGAFRKIVFNFPHLGSGEKDVEKNILQHKQLIAGFLASAVKCLDPEHDCQIHISLKSGEPYKSWKIVQTTRASVPELELQTVVPFVPQAWEGYEHRRTKGFSEFSESNNEELSKGAKVYVFRRPAVRSDDSE